MSSVRRVHENCALRLTLYQSFTVVHPRVVTAQVVVVQSIADVRSTAERRTIKKFCLHALDIFDENFRR